VILIVGEGPGPRRNREAFAADTVSGSRLRRLVGFSFAVRNGPWAWNLFRSTPWGGAARARARATLVPARAGDRLVLCGRRVAAAFGHESRPFLEPFRDELGRLVLILPHPSGRNRWWHGQLNAEIATAAVRGFVLGSERGGRRAA